MHPKRQPVEFWQQKVYEEISKGNLKLGETAQSIITHMELGELNFINQKRKENLNILYYIGPTFL